MTNEPSLSEAGEQVREDFAKWSEALQRETQQLRQTANKWIQEHPMSAVGAAFGVGFLLSGGLFSKFTARTLRFGTRFLVGKVLRELIGGAAVGYMAAKQ